MFGFRSNFAPGAPCPGRVPSGVGWALLVCLCLVPAGARAATFSASLDRDTISLGESATLSLVFTDGSPNNNSVPTPPEIPNLQVTYVGPSSQFSFINGRTSSTVTHNFTLTPRQAGDYAIPALTAEVGSERLSTQPLRLKVVRARAQPPAAINSGSQVAFLKLVLPKQQIYVGETLLAQIQLYLSSRVQRMSSFQFTSFPADGFSVGKMAENQQRGQAQIGNSIYTVVPINVVLKAIKAGNLSIGPITASFVTGGRDPFDPFGFFGGGGADQKQVTVATEAQPVQLLPLPRENVPSSFNGAVGNYQMTLTAGPTNVAAGDPITVKIQISGRGSLDALSLPEQPAWHEFKTYPPTTKVEFSDPMGLQGTKTFEQIVTPQNSDIKALPPLEFSFFDPDRKAYHTLTQPPVELVVRPGGATATPTLLAANRASQDAPPPTQDIVPNKQRLGALAQLGPPLAQQPWFVALQGVPLLAFLSAFIWRRRAESLAHNPRLRRQRQVALLLREGLEELRRLAQANKSDEFFAMLFHLLQEHLGERLDLPASAITEAVIDEHLRLRAVPDSILGPLQELFQACNLARYAPIKSSQKLAAIIPKFESVVRELQGLEL